MNEFIKVNFSMIGQGWGGPRAISTYWIEGKDRSLKTEGKKWQRLRNKRTIVT